MVYWVNEWVDYLEYINYIKLLLLIWVSSRWCQLGGWCFTKIENNCSQRPRYCPWEKRSALKTCPPHISGIKMRGFKGDLIVSSAAGPPDVDFTTRPDGEHMPLLWWPKALATFFLLWGSSFWSRTFPERSLQIKSKRPRGGTAWTPYLLKFPIVRIQTETHMIDMENMLGVFVLDREMDWIDETVPACLLKGCSQPYFSVTKMWQSVVKFRQLWGNNLQLRTCGREHGVRASLPSRHVLDNSQAPDDNNKASVYHQNTHKVNWRTWLSSSVFLLSDG